MQLQMIYFYDFLSVFAHALIFRSHVCAGHVNRSDLEGGPVTHPALPAKTAPRQGPRHEFHETCHSVTFYFMRKLIF